MSFNKLLYNKYDNWNQLESEIEKIKPTKEKGDVFEEFVYIYFRLHEDLYQISEVYMEKDIPLKYREKYELELRDSGVDGLIILNSGKAAAYQAKFRNNREKPSYAELSKFWAEARHIDYHYTVANCYDLTELSEKNEKHLAILVDEFERLDESFFDEFYIYLNEDKIERIFFEPYDFQKRMISKVIEGFKDNDRGKLIAACGTGKTFVSLKIVEELDPKFVLFVAPSLALVKQTLESWAEQSRSKFSYLCVCSDRSVSEDIDDGDISISDLSVPVSTDPDIISEFLLMDSGNRRIIFSTYHSLDAIDSALNTVGDDFYFDLTIFDEAHKTSGSKNSKMFTLGLSDEHIKSHKRLFMTATERLVRPWIVEKAKEQDRIVFSMDDESVYGPVLDRLNFGEAIETGVISDYKIIVAGIQAKEFYEFIKDDKLLVIDEEDEEFFTYAQNVFRQFMLIKSMEKFPIKKVITFHSTVRNAKDFINGVSDQDLSLNSILERYFTNFNEDEWRLDHVNGTMSAGLRNQKLDLFENSAYGIVSNARCLTEGVDVPLIDSIYFVNPKTSLIDIVQACGRALRKPRNLPDKTAYFLLPILIPEGDVEGDIINEIDFEMLHNLIQSLRDQDLRLAEWIDQINIQAAKGKTRKIRSKSDPPILVEIPKQIDLEKFESELYLRIAEVNKEPTRILPKTKKYGKGERKSDYKRIFRTIGDYNVDTYYKSLVEPTLKKFNSISDALTKDELALIINGKKSHNNLSHTLRLGLISESNKHYKLTPLGILLFKSEILFEELFKTQIMRYFEFDKKTNRILFPYRSLLKILLEVKSINRIEFIFGPYSLLDSSENSIDEAVEGIKYIRNKYPNIQILNEKNQGKVLNELNNYFGTDFSITDVWAGRTTILNQYGYFKNHLAILDGIEAQRGRDLKLIDGYTENIRKILEKDKDIEEQNDVKKLSRRFIDKLIIFTLIK
ncbi:MAG: DEAD/DEAH box helicase family protein [Candidatus Methanofastidiosa archaeon]|nr:DEAD/DEAH box helicase family protein [Candidatus Methanofastidiosa archaeon]